MEQKVLRISTLVIVCALVLRLLSGSALFSAYDLSLSPEAVAFIIFLQIFAVAMAGHVVRKIVRSDLSASFKLARFKNADTFLDLPLYIGLFGSVSSFLLISFSPQSSRLVAYSSTLIGIIFSVIARLGILYPAKEKIIADAAEENLGIKE